MKEGYMNNTGMHEECGIFGIISPENGGKLGNLTYFGLYALQHRGQESAGIAVKNGSKILCHKNVGLVSEVFNDEILQKLDGETSIGHVRYSTSGGSSGINAQPIVSNLKFGNIALSHNGNITNSEKLKFELEKRGAIFQTDADSEILLHLIAQSDTDDFYTALNESLKKLEGAFCFLIIYDDKLIAVKDRNSTRPLCVGKLRDKTVISSESCALEMIDAEFIREIEPAEILVVDKSGNMKTSKFTPETDKKFCIFEYIYFARPDSVFWGVDVHSARKIMGEKLAEKFKFNADIVIPVPDSGISAALGFSAKSKIPYEKGIIRNHYIGRTFINPTQELRNMKVKMKLNPVKSIIKGKKVVLVDDSIVRGTTSKKLVRLVKEAGAVEVHVAISSPPVISPCTLGMDTPTCNELIANSLSINEIAEHIGADSLVYLSVDELEESIESVKGFCTKCFCNE
jgi:amidophosphoribosyltransferase